VETCEHLRACGSAPDPILEPLLDTHAHKTRIVSLTEVTAAYPVGNLLSDARQLAVAVDGRHASLLECDLVENVV